jgi:hypothetical protein
MVSDGRGKSWPSDRNDASSAVFAGGQIFRRRFGCAAAFSGRPRVLGIAASSRKETGIGTAGFKRRGQSDHFTIRIDRHSTSLR